MKNDPIYQDLKTSLEEKLIDASSAADFVELCSGLQNLIADKMHDAQDKINAEVKSLVDSFGGADCTMRDLKGDL